MLMDRIRTGYLGDSSVTIVLVGKCTWARRYVDWEIYSTLRDSKYSKVNGLLALTLPSVADQVRYLPPRLDDNVIRDSNNDDVGYARWMKYPTTKSQLRDYISDAYLARTTRRELIDNRRTRRQNSSACSYGFLELSTGGRQLTSFSVASPSDYLDRQYGEFHNIGSCRTT